MDEHDPRCKCLRCTRPCMHDGGDIEYSGGVRLLQVLRGEVQGLEPWTPLGSVWNRSVFLTENRPPTNGQQSRDEPSEFKMPCDASSGDLPALTGPGKN